MLQPNSAADSGLNTVAESAVPGTTAVDASKDAVAEQSNHALQHLEHKLEITYTLPNGEAVLSPPISSVNLELPDTQETSAAASQKLQWEAAHPLCVDEALIHSMAAANAAMPLTLSYSSRVAAAVDRSSPAPAASAAPAGKAVKPAKTAAAVPEEVPWQTAQQRILPFDLAALLVGQTEVALTLPKKDLPMPAHLQAFSSITFKLQVSCTAGTLLPKCMPVVDCLLCNIHGQHQMSSANCSV